ncbi:MAG: helix-turn-helix domain-containing protein [Prevotella sp.]
MMLNLPIDELRTLRRLQHSKEFEHYWAQITCILMLAHGHDAKTVAYDLGISLSSVYNYVDSYKSGGISKLTDSHYKGCWGLLDSLQIVAPCSELHCKVYTDTKSVARWVKGTRIRQMFLPPYSPNLNLIERPWKMLWKKVINMGFYRTRKEFRRAVMIFFEHIADYKKEWESLLTLNFRLVNSKTISLWL